MKAYVRMVLAIFAALELVLGVWLTFVPRSFYDHVPTVDWDPPYAEHAFRDFGAASLGLTVVLIAAVIRLDRFLTTVALLAYVVFSLPHAVFHVSHLHGDNLGWSIVLATFVSLMVVLPLSALAAARKLT
jgi:hypothetical protein